ncbi:MAG: putative porin [Bacteroidales bacterium]|nr:putative porin [Bacteroidales bacterium]
MAKVWADILLPMAIAGTVAAQTLGVEVNRARVLHAWFPEAKRDTVQVDSTRKPLDSLAKNPIDSLAQEEDFELFGAPEDTTPTVFARDTMKVPDSLKVTDPFLYQWYVATKDSYTHKLVVDSLKAEGDSLIWPRVDSLFLADSTFKAQLAWEKKWASMSKAERKRWIYENVQLPAIRHRQDSIFKAKDSLKHIKDSIIENTPRVLETPFLPDSMHFKRLVTWKRNRLYNSIETFEWDTTANYHFYDYPFMRDDAGATWLGMPGSAVQQYNFFRRDKERSTSFYQAQESWTYNADNFTFYNTKTPYTELEYSGNLFSSKTLSADNFRVFTTQNILPSLNIALEMKRYGGAGTLKNEQTDNRTYFVSGNYLGKKYNAHAGFIFNKISRQESGGMVDNLWIRDTTVDVREINVNLAAATNSYRKMTVFLDQSYRIPFDFIQKLRHRRDTTWTPSDSLNADGTTGFVGTSTEFSTYSKKYADNVSDALSTFYNDVFNIHPSKSADSLRTLRLENRIFVRLQPWKNDAIVSKVEGGIGDRFQTFYLQDPDEVLFKPSSHKWNSIYAYAGVEGRFRRYLQWDASGQYTFAGQEVNDFSINANAALNFYPFRRHPQSPISLKAHFETGLKSPDFYQQHFYSNHFRWENSFGKVSTTKINATLDIPRWQLKAEMGYALLANQVFYDTLGIVRQHGTPESVFTAGLTKNFVFGPVHLDNTALVQLSSNQDVLPLPTLALNLRWYAQFNIKKVLQLQLGANVRYTTLWYAPSYNPVTGTFSVQNKERYGNCPVFDVFINAQWKKCCLFLKLENAGNGWPMERKDYFTAHHYIQTSRVIKVGVSWPFYPHLGKLRTLSARAGSGGNSGGGGGLSALKSGLNGMAR